MSVSGCPLLAGGELIGSDWLLEVVGIAAGMEVLEVSLGLIEYVGDVVKLGVADGVIDKAPSATTFMKATAIQTLIWFWRLVQTSYCLLQHQSILKVRSLNPAVDVGPSDTYWPPLARK